MRDGKCKKLGDLSLSFEVTGQKEGSAGDQESAEDLETSLRRWRIEVTDLINASCRRVSEEISVCLL